MVVKLQMNWKDETRICSAEISQYGLYDVPSYLNSKHTEEKAPFLQGSNLGTRD